MCVRVCVYIDFFSRSLRPVSSYTGEGEGRLARAGGQVRVYDGGKHPARAEGCQAGRQGECRAAIMPEGRVPHGRWSCTDHTNLCLHPPPHNISSEIEILNTIQLKLFTFHLHRLATFSPPSGLLFGRIGKNSS